MPHTSRFPILRDLGLNENESLIYELLLEAGTTKARDLVTKSGIGRGNVYNVLMQLQQKHLVLAIEGKQTSYQAIDPSALRRLLDLRLQDAARLEDAFASALPQLSSAFNLATQKPAIQIFEGVRGFETALEDSLTSHGEILTFFDPVALQGELATMNKRYVRKRVERKISKRIILPDIAESRRYAEAMTVEHTRIMLVKDLPIQFRTAMELYDDKICFLTLRTEKTVAVILQDPDISALQRSQFEYIWNANLKAGARIFQTPNNE